MKLQKRNAGCRVAQLTMMLFATSALPLMGQIDALLLSSGTSGLSGGVSLSLGLLSPPGSEPAALQWTFRYPASNVRAISTTAGPAAVAAGKSLSCFGSAGSFTCLLSGVNRGVIANGNVAVLSLTMASGASITPVGVVNGAASSALGNAVTVLATGGIVAGGPVLAVPASLTCSPAALGSNATASCSVSLTQVAPLGGAGVSLASNNPLLSVPASVNVAAGSATATFNAASKAVATNQTATLTATLNGGSVTANVALLAPNVPSSLTCSPSSLGANATALCTVSLNQSAPLGGSSVSLTSNNSALTVPASVNIAAGSAIATFNAASKAIATNQIATLTATLNGGSATANVTLLAATVPSSLTCNPNSLGPNATALCTVSLNQPAPPGGSTVSLTSNSSALSVPALVNIVAGSASATFNAASKSIATNQTATLTATLNGGSATANVALLALTVPSSLTCNPNSLGANATALCTVSLNQPAAPGGSSVSLTSNNPLLSVPASVTIAAGSAAATFSAASKAVSTPQTATLTATLNGASATATIALRAPVTLTTLTCTPSNLGSNATASCSLTLNQPAPAGGSTVALSSSSAALTVPPSVNIPANAGAATFSATTNTVSASQAVTVTAALNGASIVATFNLNGSAVPSTLYCSPSIIGPNSASVCTVTLNQNAPAAGTTVALSSGSSSLSVPSSLTIRSGFIAARFTATTGQVNASQLVAISAALNGVSKSYYLTIQAASKISLVACNPAILNSGASATCTIQLSQAIAKAITIPITFNSPFVSGPPTIVIPANSTAAAFTVIAGNVPSNVSALVTAAGVLNSQSALLTLLPNPAPQSTLTGISCEVNAESNGTCEVSLSNVDESSVATLRLTASAANVRVPAEIVTRPGQKRVAFQFEADPPTQEQLTQVAAHLGNAMVEHAVTLRPNEPRPSRNTIRRFAKPGAEFTFSATGLKPVSLPTGAAFDEPSGRFTWTPELSQRGPHEAVFQRATEKETLQIEVESGTPVITGMAGAACSPGALATLQGRWLAAGAVTVNDVQMQTTRSSATDIEFICPESLPGASLAVAVRTPAGESSFFTTVSRRLSPSIFSVTHGGASPSLIRNPRDSAYPAQAGDTLVVHASGIAQALTVLINFAGLQIVPSSIAPGPTHAGVWEIAFTVPAGLAPGSESPLFLQALDSNGATFSSNRAQVAIEQ